MSETLDHIHTLGLPFLACFQSKLVEFLVIFPSYSSVVYKYVACVCRVVKIYAMLRHAKFTTHAPLTLSVLLIDKRMIAGSMTRQKEAGKVTNYLSVPIRDIFKPGVQLVNLVCLLHGLWTSA